MKMKRLISLAIALLLVCGMPVSVFAAEYDLAAGSVTVTATADGQTVTHGDNDAVQDDAPVIIQTNNETPTTNTITIKAEENTTANVTIQDVNIVISDPEGDPKDHSGEAAVTIDVAENASANVTLDGVNINVGETGGFVGGLGEFIGEAAVQIRGNGDVTLELDGENTLQSGCDRAGVEKNNGGNLTITDEAGTDGSLEATGGDWGSGIGGGSGGSGSDITITGSAEVTAKGGKEGAGIGGGWFGSGSHITIEGSAEVTAKGGVSGAGIGGGRESTGSEKITVSGNAQVKAQGGEKSVQSNVSHFGAGAAIGEGGKYNFGAEADPGDDVTPNTDDLNEGWIATYDPSITNLDTAIPDTLTYQDNGQLTTSSNAAPVGKQEPTCTKPGHEAGYEIDGKLVAVTIPATGHSFTNYISDGKATCTADDTKTAQCDHDGCKITDTVTDPGTMKDHTFTTYTPDPGNLATCTKAGTKTAKCDHCDATHTIPDPIKDHSMGESYTVTAATCQAEGVERADCKNCNYYETRPLKKADHSYGDFTSDNNATCTADGTKTRKCIWCDLPDTVPDPGTMKEHSFTNYIYDNNATYSGDGTRTAKCDHCDATDTIPAPGTRLPFYKVKGQDGAQLMCKEEKQDGVLTITVDADCASLTGTFGGIKALKARGVDTIVFVTKGAASTFAIEDLLAQGASGDTYSLTHDGSTVTFTLGNGADLSKILK